jgi:type VI secretion system protein ImpI
VQPLQIALVSSVWVYSPAVESIFVLRATRFDGSLLGERRIATLPIRIGRNALNDLPLLDPGIAEFHAIVEDIGGRLCVRDLNSPQGVGVRVPPQAFPTRIPARASADLRSGGFQFALGNAALVSLFMDTSPSRPPHKTGAAQGAVLGNPSLLRGPGSTLQLPRVSTPGRGASASSLPPSPSPLPPSASPPPRSPSTLPPTLAMDFSTTVALPRTPPPPTFAAPRPPSLPAELRQREASPSTPPSLSPQYAEGSDGRAGVHTEHFTMPLDSLALAAVRELAASLVPERPLETTGDLARFVTKLHDLAEVFCRSFVPLREGHAQFVSSLDLQRAARQRGQRASNSSLAVESAQTPQALALALLDFREQSADGPQAVESIFADLMIHQVALLSGLMQGVRALLSELSPDAVEDAIGHPGGLGVDLGGGRSKAVWAAYRERYANLAEDEHALGRIFGPEFAQAYREYREREE